MIVPGTLADSSDPTGPMSSTSACSTSDGRGLLTLLHGSPQRVMVPYFDPRQGVTAQNASSRLITTVMGRFGGTGDIADLFGSQPNRRLLERVPGA